MILSGKHGQVEISDQLIDSMQAVYAVDVRAELAKMDVWLHCNAARRPVRMMVFVKAWLKRAKPIDKTREARRANIAELCGWNKRNDPPGLDGTVIQPPRLIVWEPDDEHVGRLPPSRHH